MAENNKDDIENTSSSHGEDDQNQVPQRPDLGIGNAAGASRSSPNDEAPPQAGPDVSNRREENPFSFKRFLSQDQGARRKEYPMDHSAHNPPMHAPEMSSMLPDFVQDHLVVEQCYLSSPAHHAPLPFDLPLPADDRPEPGVGMQLPDFLSDGPIHSHRNDTDPSPFLVDDPPLNGHLSPGPPRSEIERLQRETDSLRRQLHERNRRIQLLESEVELLHSRDARETDSLEYALQQVESNLRQTSKRATAAEQQVTKLKTENKILKSRLEMLDSAAAGPSTSTSYAPRSQNQRLAQDLRSAAAAAEILETLRPENRQRTASIQNSADAPLLLTALTSTTAAVGNGSALSAQSQAHLRSLMSGIDNLKALASTLDNKTNFDFDDYSEGASGPAL